MKPKEVLGMIVHSRRFGDAKIVAHEGGRRFICESLQYPGIRFLATWGTTIHRARS